MSTPVKQHEAEQAPSAFTAIPSTPKRPLTLPPAALHQDQRLAAIAVQIWWRRHQAVNKAAAAMLLQRPPLQQAAQVLALQSSAGFEDVLTKIQNKELISSIVNLLAVVSGPEFSAPPMSPRGARGSPWSLEAAQQQQARKFLTAIMIKHHPEEVIVSSSSDDDDSNDNTVSLGDLEARLLCVAANLALVSAVGLIQALDELEEQQQQQQSGGALGVFRLRLNTFNFARTFMNASLQVLQARQARGMAASFLASYGEAYAYLRDAERSQEDVLIAAARQSLDKVRMGIMQVLGREATEKHCRSVEEALELEEPFVVLMPGEIKVMLPPVRARTPRPSSSSSSSSSAASPMVEGAGDGAESRSRTTTSSSSSSSSRFSSPSSAFGQTTEAGQLPAVPSSLAALLRNEHLAHEIILNPDFKLEEKKQALDSSASGSAEGALAAELDRVREAMEKVFWDRLVMAMTPAEQEGPEDFVSGAVVQLRFGGPQGSLFAARVEGVNAEEGTLDVVYLMDGVKERRPLGDFRLKNDPLDYEPLLALLEDVREKLTELTPRRKDLAAELQAHLDTQLLGQMARQGLLDAVTIRGLLAFVVERLVALQAPIRAAETGAWFSGIEVQAQEALRVGVGGQGGSGKPTPAFVALLPRVFQTIFERIDETRRDIANAHVQMLRPFLAQHGVAYERQNFAERLREGEVKLVHTQAWLHEVLASVDRAPQLPALAQGDAQAHRALLANALLCLLRKPVRLDNPVTAKLPETLFYDGRRLAALRDELDRLSLVAVYSSLLRQFLAIQGPSLPLGQSNPVGNILVALETRLHTVLQDDGAVTLPHLVEEVVQSANQIYAAAGTTMSTDQATTLRGMLNNTASLENPLFNLLFARLADVLSLYARGDAAGARELVGRFGFRSFDAQLAATGDGLRRVLEHNLAVHGELYSRLLQDAASALLLDAQVGPANQQGGGGASSNSSSSSSSSMQVFP
jgi:hypothetical protein